jgi:hypothetical protein
MVLLSRSETPGAPMRPASLMVMVLVMILEGEFGGGFLLDFGEVGEQAFVGEIQRYRM